MIDSNLNVFKKYVSFDALNIVLIIILIIIKLYNKVMEINN